jgi:hypothetical protein
MTDVIINVALKSGKASRLAGPVIGANGDCRVRALAVFAKDFTQ